MSEITRPIDHPATSIAAHFTTKNWSVGVRALTNRPYALSLIIIIVIIVFGSKFLY